MASWTPVGTLTDNESQLNAETLNGPIIDLRNRTDYLKDLIAKFGYPFPRITVAFDSIAAGIEKGCPVYVTSDGTLDKAVGTYSVDDELGASNSSYLIGIYIGDYDGKYLVLVNGTETLQLEAGQSIPWLAQQETNSGVYFLSTDPKKPGTVTQNPSGARILVGTYIFDTVHNKVRVIITPTHNNYATSHVHRTEILGTAISTATGGEDNKWSLVQGATYEYKIQEGSSLATFWPPSPLYAVTLVLDGAELVYDSAATSTPAAGKYAVVYNNGEYKLRVTFDSTKSDNICTSAVLHYVRCVWGDSGPVTSIKGVSPIYIRRCGTTDDHQSSVGDLQVEFRPETEDDTEGYNVLKSYNDDTGKFGVGPVVGSIKAGAGISIIVNESSGGETDGRYYGNLTIQASGATHGEFDTIALQNAKQEMIGLFPYIKLPEYNPSIPSAFVSKFQVPVELADTTNGYRVLFYASIFGFSDTSSDTPCRLVISHSILPDLYGPSTTTNLDGVANSIVDTVVSFNFKNGYTAKDPILLTNDEGMQNLSNVAYVENLFPYNDSTPANNVIVKPGYSMSIRIEISDTTAYESDVGFLNLRWGVKPVA